jgi:hypothetical protein
VSDEAVVTHGREELNALPTRHSVVVGTSLGSLLLPDVAELALPAVWLATRARAFFTSLPQA